MTLRRENMQRLQIGGFGLIAVMLLVGLASIANDRASNEVPVTQEIADPGIVASQEEGAPETAKEPLAELGAVQAPEETPIAKTQ